MSRWRTWGEIPTFMKNDFTLKYYRHLSRKRTSMVFKRIFDPSDLFSVNPYHIKTAGNVILKSIPDKIKQRDFEDSPLFLFSHCCKRTSASPVLPVFHFYKYKISSIPGNQIDLTVPAAKISLHDPQAFLFQKFRRYFLIISTFRSSVFCQKKDSFLF